MNWLSYGNKKTMPKRKQRKSIRKNVFKTNSQMKRNQPVVVEKKNT